MSKKRRSFLAAFGVLDWTLTLVAFAAIGYGAYSGFTCKDDWEKVAAPLFSLASGFLFVVALLVQLREHRQTIEEMEQANTNHAALLLVAKQEKEFNVCLQAAQAANTEFKELRNVEQYGADAIRQFVNSWARMMLDEQWTGKAVDTANPFMNLRNVEEVFHGFNKIYELNVRLYWTLFAISDKDLAADDRAYLNTMVIPLIRELGKAQSEALLKTTEKIDQLLGLDNAVLLSKRMDRHVLNSYRKELQKLYDVRTRRPELAQASSARAPMNM
ncbi:MAG: hypothetical protein IPG69_12640 [Flavobacteriales bacterium]|nr:hypothetical protein [Flavobacteriales bacterium]